VGVEDVEVHGGGGEAGGEEVSGDSEASYVSTLEVAVVDALVGVGALDGGAAVHRAAVEGGAVGVALVVGAEDVTGHGDRGLGAGAAGRLGRFGDGGGVEREPHRWWVEGAADFAGAGWTLQASGAVGVEGAAGEHEHGAGVVFAADGEFDLGGVGFVDPWDSCGVWGAGAEQVAVDSDGAFERDAFRGSVGEIGDEVDHVLVEGVGEGLVDLVAVSLVSDDRFDRDAGCEGIEDQCGSGGCVVAVAAADGDSGDELGDAWPVERRDLGDGVHGVFEGDSFASPVRRRPMAERGVGVFGVAGAVGEADGGPWFEVEGVDGVLVGDEPGSCCCGDDGVDEDLERVERGPLLGVVDADPGVG
jgi:hypothetical protein